MTGINWVGQVSETCGANKWGSTHLRVQLPVQGWEKHMLGKTLHCGL